MEGLFFLAAGGFGGQSFPLGLRGVFHLQSGLLPESGYGKTPSLPFPHSAYGIVGMILIVFGLVLYPLLGLMLGRVYPQWIFSPMFPCPMNIWVMGMLLMTDKPLPRCLVMVPFLWGILGFFWVTAGLTEDILLVFANITGAVVLWSRDLRYERELQKQIEAMRAAAESTE